LRGATPVRFSRLVGAAIFIAALILVIFAVDIGSRWWRENEWRRRWRERERDEE